MKIVIDIPEDLYNNIREGGFWLKSGLTLSDAYDFIKYGTTVSNEGEWIRTGREVASLDEMKALGNIPHGNFTWKKCSNCLSEEIYEMPFCPHCGADMGFPKHKAIKTIANAPTVSTEDCDGCPYCPNSNSGIPIGVE